MYEDLDSENLQIKYQQFPDKSVIVYDIPDGEKLIDVKMRPLTRRDRTLVQGIKETDPDAGERLLSIIIVKWGEDRDGITSIELMEESKDIAVEILTQVLNKFFQKQYRFVQKR